MTDTAPPRLYHCPGEPAGIGPELLVRLAQSPVPARRIAVADSALLKAAAARLDLPLALIPWQEQAAPSPPATLYHLSCDQPVPVQPGQPNPANATYLLDCLRRAVAGARAAHSAMVTGPLHKATINQAGIRFSGHTEFIAAECGGATPLMMLLAGDLRVALATTHLPLRDVPTALTRAGLEQSLQILVRDLRQRFGLACPRIQVLGLNPHAGESGHLGDEELTLIAPAMAAVAAREKATLKGPVPADTAFTPERLAACDAVLAMYHDQGLPVLKHRGFGRAVNLTLGLPIIRSSVDHGTAFDIAGQGIADPGSLSAAEQLALQLAAA